VNPIPFSIVIPTHDRGELLQRVIPSYVETGASEIIVVDDASGPPHQSALVALAGIPPVRLITLGRHSGQAVAKNEGSGAASTPWVVFGEDDMWFPPEYPTTLIAHAEAEGAAVAAGSAPLIHPRLLDGPPADLESAIRSAPAAEPRPDRFLGIPWPVERLESGDIVTPLLMACAAVRRSVFDVAEFDPRFTGNAFREETDFFFSCMEAGIRTIFCSHASCGHMKADARSTPGGSWTMSRPRYGVQMLRNNWRFLAKHRAALERARVQSGLSPRMGLMQARFAVELLGRIRAKTAGG
jgi:GT2 family glycosyltransferase